MKVTYRASPVTSSKRTMRYLQNSWGQATRVGLCAKPKAVQGLRGEYSISSPNRSGRRVMGKHRLKWLMNCVMPLRFTSALTPFAFATAKPIGLPTPRNPMDLEEGVTGCFLLKDSYWLI